MTYLNIYSSMSLAELEDGVSFDTKSCASIRCVVDETTASFEIDAGHAWNRSDIKELIQFLKAVRRLIPKEEE